MTSASAVPGPRPYPGPSGGCAPQPAWTDDAAHQVVRACHFTRPSVPEGARTGACTEVTQKSTRASAPFRRHTTSETGSRVSVRSLEGSALWRNVRFWEFDTYSVNLLHEGTKEGETMSGSSAGRRSEWFPSCVSLWCSSVCLLWLIRVVPAHIGSTGDLLGRQRVSGVPLVVSSLVLLCC